MRGTRLRLLGGFTVLIVLLGVVGAGCSDSDDSSSSVPVFHEGDTVPVEKGQEFVIALTSNPSTGYSWQADDNPKVKYISSTQLNDSTQGVGAAGTQELKFKAVETGDTTLELAYFRPFEGGMPPADTASFDVTIK